MSELIKKYEIYKIIICTILFGCASNSFGQAPELLGGKLQSEIFEDTTLILHIKLYRKCNSGTIINGVGGNIFFNNALYYLQSYKLPPVKKITNVTLACKGQPTTCNPANSINSNFGIEEFYYVDTFRMSDTIYRNIVRYQMARKLPLMVSIFHVMRKDYPLNISMYNDGLIISTEIFLNDIYNCKRKSNKSPELKYNLPVQFVKDRIARHTIGAIDSVDHDVFVIKNTFPLKDLSQSLNFRNFDNPYNLNNPIGTYCVPQKNGICKANPKSNPPIGFYIDTLTGNIVFTSSVLGYYLYNCQLSEYRNSKNGNKVLISRTYSEFQILIDTCYKSNNSPVISAEDSLEVILGDSLNVDFPITDNLASNQYKQDTVYVSTEKELPNMRLSVKSMTTRNKIVNFKFTPDSAQYSLNPYRIDLFATDKNGPIPGTASKQILVKVKKRGQATMSYKFGNCNKIYLSSKTNISNVIYEWKIRDSITGTITMSNKALDTLYVSGGKKYITLNIRHTVYGFPIQTDSFLMKFPPVIQFKLNGLACVGNAMNFDLTPVRFINSPKIYCAINNDSFQISKYNTNQYVIKNKNVKIAYRCKDTFGCNVGDSTFILAKPNKPIELISKTLIACEKQQPLNICSNVHYLDSITYKYFTNSNLDSVAKNQIYLDGSKNITNNQSSETVKIKVVSKNQIGCESMDSFTVIISKQPLDKLRDTSICQNSKFLKLNRIVHNKFKDTLKTMKWTTKLWPMSVTVSEFFNVDTVKLGKPYENKFGGTYTLVVRYSNSDSSCFWKDSLRIKVNNEPNLKITSKNMHCCEFNDPNIHSKLIIDSINGVITYKWISYNGDHAAVELEKYKFNPSYNINSPVGKWQLTAAVSSNGCLSNPDTSLLVIHPKPKPDFNILPNSILTIDSTRVKFQNATVSNSDTLKFIWDLGEGILNYDKNKVDQNYNYPAQNKNYQIKLTAISQWGCSDSLMKTLSISVNSSSHTFEKSSPFYIDNYGEVHAVENSIHSIHWYTMEGVHVLNIQPNMRQNLPIGFYMVLIKTNDGKQIAVKKVISEE
jgi:hypothetical protein